MRDLLDQNRALSPATIRMAINVLAALFVLSLSLALFVHVVGLFKSSGFILGLLTFSTATGVLLALYLMVRLQAEAVMAAHRNTDRLAILTEAINSQLNAEAKTHAAGSPDTSSQSSDS